MKTGDVIVTKATGTKATGDYYVVAWVEGSKVHVLNWPEVEFDTASVTVVVECTDIESVAVMQRIVESNKDGAVARKYDKSVVDELARRGHTERRVGGRRLVASRRVSDRAQASAVKVTKKKP